MVWKATQMSSMVWKNGICTRKIPPQKLDGRKMRRDDGQHKCPDQDFFWIWVGLYRSKCPASWKLFYSINSLTQHSFLQLLFSLIHSLSFSLHLNFLVLYIYILKNCEEIKTIDIFKFKYILFLKNERIFKLKYVKDKNL